jgi:hypothetical protein
LRWARPGGLVCLISTQTGFESQRRYQPQQKTQQEPHPQTSSKSQANLDYTNHPMGLFDSLQVQKELPIPPELQPLPINWAEEEFQTKDLDNSLAEYLIKKNGDLVEIVTERQYIPHKNPKDAKFPKMWAQVIEKEPYERPLNHHGTLLFYTSVGLTPTQDAWVEFEAYYSYGKLDKIELKAFEKVQAQKLSLKKWEEEYKKEQTRPWARFKHYANYIGWGWTWRKIANSLQHLSEILTKTQMFIRRNLT